MERTAREKPILCVGVDPGINGHIAITYTDDCTVRLIAIPTRVLNFKKSRKNGRVRYYKTVDSCALFDVLLRSVYSKASKYRIVCYIEKSQVVRGQGIVSAFSYGSTYGRILSAIECSLQCTVTEVSPQEWKNHFGLSKPGTKGVKSKERKKDKKHSSYLMACKLFPDIADKLITKRGRELHDIAEAILISVFGLSRLSKVK